MGEPQDPYTDPDIQSRMAARAESWLGIERLVKTPTVIFDRGVDEFWTTVFNSSRLNLLSEQIGQNVHIPINADALNLLASNHSFFNGVLAEARVAMIPTRVNFEGRALTLGGYSNPQSIPGMMVRKVSFEDNSFRTHGGAGVSMVRGDLDQARPKSADEFFQAFVVPPTSYLRDTRVYLVDGEPVAGYTTRAQQPLRDENLTGEVLPSPEQYPTAHHLGIKESLTDEVRAGVFPFAQKIGEVLKRKAYSLSYLYSPLSVFGFGSLDFVFDSYGQPLTVDFDLSPDVTDFEGINQIVAARLAGFLAQMSHIQGIDREIMLIGSPIDKFLRMIFRDLKSRQQKVAFKQSLLETVLKEKD